MTILQSDIKLYKSDQSGNIDLNNEITGATTLFPEVADIDNDAEIKIWVKNTHLTESLLQARFYSINGFTVNNTNGSPIIIASTELYNNISAGTYSLTFPTINSIVDTPPGGQSLPAQTIIVDGNTKNAVQLLTNLSIFLVFNSGLTVGDTATIVISTHHIQSAIDNSGSPGTYANRNSYNNGVDLGTLAAGQAKALWLKQVIADGTAAGTYKWQPIIRGKDD